MTDLIVTISTGKIRGKRAEDYQGGEFFSFLGIPYAKPPIGPLRFKAPEPPEPWTDVLDATHEGDECPARHLMFAYVIGTEKNCLNLNVYTKELPTASGSNLKPVMVWIHGGAFLHGSNKSEFFGPDFLMTEDIVLVSINYRLGAFGFLSCEDPSLGVPGNAGMKDMVLALKWVQSNIESFGGNPGNVTIFGESAGAASVHYLYVSPLAKGLFHKAIIQSGSTLNCWARGCANARILARDLGLRETNETKILEYLQDLSVEKIIKAQHKAPDTFSADNIRPYGPVIEPVSDSAFLTEDPVQILRNGTFNDVPLIMGYTSKEGLLYEAAKKVNASVNKKNLNYEDEIPFELKIEKNSERSKQIATRIQKFYKAEDAGGQRAEAIHNLKSDTQFVHGIVRALNLQKEKSEAPMYLYRMSLDTSLNFYKSITSTKSLYTLFFLYYLVYKAGDGCTKNLLFKLIRLLPRNEFNGVCHADDLGYLFKTFLTEKLQLGSVEERSVRRFVRLWTNFAKTGNPTPQQQDELLDNVQWRAVTKGQLEYLDIGVELTTRQGPDEERLQFWDSVYTS